MLRFSSLFLIFCALARAELERIEILSRDSAGPDERLVGRAYFSVDPKLSRNREIADIALAATNAEGKVEFSSDFLVWRPRESRHARGAVFLEVVNRGGPQSLSLISGARSRDPVPERWDLGDRFLLDQGFTVVFLGWQFDVTSRQGLTFHAPSVPVKGIVRASYSADGAGRRYAFGLSYCAADPEQKDARLTYRLKIDEPAKTLGRSQWRFGPNGCSVSLAGGFDAGLYEAVYEAKDPPVAGLGLAAIRDFVAYLKYGGKVTTLRESPASLNRIIGYGYSQSGRLLRQFVRDGFNADEHGRSAFDGLMISSAGSGGASVNHRFAMPGEAGNSVLSILRPIDVPPFNDGGLLAKAEAAHVTPRIFYTFSSTEYWARAGSLTHTTPDGQADVPLSARSRLYLLTGTAHSAGPFPPARDSDLLHYANFAEQRWVTRALLLDLDAWIRTGAEPPPSRYPSVARAELVPREGVRFPKVPALPFPEYMPRVWRMDYGPEFSTKGIVSQEPPTLGQPYTVLVPQVDADGNDLGGVPLPEVAVPLGTYTGWNVRLPELSGLDYLAGLYGSFEPFARTNQERERNRDPRRSIAERYRNLDDYLKRIERAARGLAQDHFMLPEDVREVVRRAGVMWDALVDHTNPEAPR